MLIANPDLQGKAWGQPRLDSAIQFALAWVDPRDSKHPKVLATTTLHRAHGRSKHEIYFRVEGIGRTAALRQATVGELLINVTVSTFAKVKTDILTAEAAAVSTAANTFANEVASKSGKDVALVIPVGGDLKGISAIRLLFKRRIEAELAMREGEVVPPEVLNSVLDRLLSEIHREVDLQAANQKEMVSLLVGGQLLVSAPIGQISGALASVRKSLETKEVAELQTAHEANGAGGINVLGIVGIGGAGSSGESKAERKERLKRELGEVSKEFSASLPTVTAMDVKQLQKLVAADSTTIELTFSRFSVRWQPLSFVAGLETTQTHSSRLAALKKERQRLVKEIESGLARIMSTSALQHKAAASHATLAGDLTSSIQTALDAHGSVCKVEGMGAWAEHLKKINHRADGPEVFRDYMAAVEPTTGKRRAQQDEETKTLRNLHSTKTTSGLDTASGLIKLLRTNGNELEAGAKTLVAKFYELQNVDDEILTLLELGAE